MSQPVLCIHSFSASSRQYSGLAKRLGSRFRVIAPDLYGHGQSPAWQLARRFTLADEAAPFEAAIPEDAPVHLVAHSYGAAVALRIANANRARVRAMVLYEPAIWGTLSYMAGAERATAEIEAVRDDTVRDIDAGRLEQAAERFIDYWSGAGAWAATPAERRPKLVATVRSLRDAWRATFIERWTAGALRSLDVPCLLLTGTGSTAAARYAVQLLAEHLPSASLVSFDGLGHLGPLTHPQTVEPAIEAFLLRHTAPLEAAA